MNAPKPNLETSNVSAPCLDLTQRLTSFLSLATSGTFNVQTPRMEDSMPYSDNGGILDVHVTSFQAAIDNLLSVARLARLFESPPPKPAPDRFLLDPTSIPMSSLRCDTWFTQQAASPMISEPLNKGPPRSDKALMMSP